MSFFDYGQLRPSAVIDTGWREDPKKSLVARASIHTDAQETASRPSAKIIMLGGAIKWWWQSTCMACGHWDEADIIARQVGCLVNPSGRHSPYVWWNSPEHRQYVAWRDRVRAALIDAGYLTYAPWMAFKGTWDERAQFVNDGVLSIADAFVVLSPDYAITEGTDEERETAKLYDVPVIDAPPPSKNAPVRGWNPQDPMQERIDALLGTLGAL